MADESISELRLDVLMEEERLTGSGKEGSELGEEGEEIDILVSLCAAINKLTFSPSSISHLIVASRWIPIGAEEESIKSLK